MSEKERSEKTLRLSRDSSAERSKLLKASMYSSDSRSSRCASRQSSSGKYDDSWKMYLLPEFREEQFKKNTQPKKAVTTSEYSRERSQKKYETPKRYPTNMSSGYFQTTQLSRPLLSIESSQYSHKKSRLRRATNNHSQIKPGLVERVMQENKMLKEQLQYMREKFQSCLMIRQNKQAEEKSSKEKRSTARFNK